MARSSILFDLDGTLLDTLEDLADSMNAVLLRLGYQPHPLASYRHFVGDGVANLARRVLPEPARGDETAVREVVRRMREEYGGRWHEKTHPYDGIPELLDAARSRGVKLAVLSNKPHPATREIISHFFPGVPFDAVLGARPEIPIKPDAAAALEVARLLSRPPADFVYVGDTNTDMKTAVAAGMYPAGALWGFREADELIAAGARSLVAHPRDVLKLL